MNKVKSGTIVLLLTLSLYFLIMSESLSTTVIGPLIPAFINDFGLNVSQGGLVTLFQGIGGMAGVIIGYFLTSKFARQNLIITLYALYCITYMVMSFSGVYILMLILFFVVAGSTRMMEISLNAYVSDLNPTRRGLTINLLHGFFGIGALAGPLLSAAFISAGTQWHFVFRLLSICCAVFLLFFIVMQKTSSITDMPVSKDEPISVFILMKKPEVLKFCFLQMLFAGLAFGVSAWLPTYMINEFDIQSVVTGLPVAAFWIGVIVFRVGYSLFAGRFATRRIFVFFALCAGVIFAVAVFINHPIVYIISFVLIGFLCSPIVPLSIAELVSRYPKNAGTVSALIFFFLAAGQMLLPWLIGIVADHVNFYAVVVLLAIIPFAIALLSSRLPKGKEPLH